MSHQRPASRRRHFAARDVHRLFESNLSYDKLSVEELAGILEARQEEMRCAVDASAIVRSVQSGKGCLTATRSAVAFTIDHGLSTGIELRYLYVARGRRHRGAARALVARIRARHSARQMLIWCRSRRQANAARLAGFSVQAHGDDWWQMALLPIAAESAPVAERPLLPCPPPREPFRPAESERRFDRFLKTLCATAVVTAASVSCLDT